jgi:uncharacterized repeat protein (TIGR02543 family)
MSKKFNKIVVFSLASIMAFSVPLYACNQPTTDSDEVEVKFDYNDEASRPYYSYTEKNGSVKEPTTPLRDGYQFDGWYTAKEGGTKVDFSKTFDSDVTLYAQWSAKTYTVTLDYNYENSTPTVKTYQYGDVVEKPEDPTWENNTFYYWQSSAETDSSEVEFPYTVTSDVTFYARWGTASQYKVTFNANYENSGEAQVLDVIPGNKVKEKQITKPTRTYYSFKGWATSPDATEADIISLPYTPTSDVTLYAVWSRLTYRVTFNNNYPDLADDARGTTVSVEGGATVDKPADPTRPDYTFTGWYTSARGGEEVTFPMTPTGTTSYYAHWTLTNAVKTNIFDAEFTEINPTKKYYGYSGEATGVSIIVNDTSNKGETGASTQDYPLVSNQTSHNSYYITYQYEINDELIFEIYSDKAVTGATLKASLATEFKTGLEIGPDGDNAYKVYVNGTELKYNTLSFGGTQPATGQYKGTFSVYTLGNINLVAGKNTIRLVTSNTNAATMGGAMKAVAPMIDYIQVDATGATLSWYPIYDNIYTW